MHAFYEKGKNKQLSWLSLPPIFLNCQMSFEIKSPLNTELGPLNLISWFKTSDYAQI